MLLAQIKPKSTRNVFFYPWWMRFMFTCVLGCSGASTVFFKNIFYQYANLSEGADCVGEQLRGDKECPFSGVTKSGRV